MEQPLNLFTKENSLDPLADVESHIMRGCCLDLLQRVPRDSVDLLVTDPPYYTPAKISQTRARRNEGARSLGNYGILYGFMRQWALATSLVLKPTASVYIFCDSRTYPIFFLAWHDILIDSRSLIWDKGRSLLGYTWRRQHEMIMWGRMADAKSIESGDGDIIRHDAVPVKERVHAAQKPIALLQKLIRKQGALGDVVLDTFAGSGTTGIAAVREGRRFIGMEVQSDNPFGVCDVADTGDNA